ncbi:MULTISPECIES: Fur-regulated basic protein FbpA [Bacillus]
MEKWIQRNIVKSTNECDLFEESYEELKQLLKVDEDVIY